MSQSPQPGADTPNPTPRPPSATSPGRWGRRARAALGRIAAALGMIATVHLAAMAPAQADVLTKMNGYFEDAGAAANASGPTAHQGQSAGYYTLGNVWTRFPQKNAQPFNLQLPSVRAGCGGIDLFSGSFSFINASELVALMKATANNALGYAFKLAIDSISPEIGKVMNEFQQAAQMLNDLNINSCETAQALVDDIWGEIDTKRNTVCSAVGNSQGVFSDWAAARQGCNNGDEREETIAGNDDPALREQSVGEDHNYTWEALRRANRFGGYDKEFSELIMTLVGTVVTRKPTEKGQGGTVKIYGPAEESVATALLDGTDFTGPARILRCRDDTCFDVQEQTITVPIWIALRPRIKRLIREMGTQVRRDEPLTAPQIQLLNISSIPLYKILAVQAYAHQNLSDDEIETLAQVVAMDLMLAMLDNMMDRVQQSQVHFQAGDQATAQQWRQQIAEARQRYTNRDVETSNKFDVTMKLIEKSMWLESTLQNSLTPGMAAALNFSRGLNNQGLQ